MKRITVTASTIGQQNASHIALSGGYRYRGDKNWPEDRSRYKNGGDLAGKPAVDAGGEVGAAARQQRLADFTAALARLGEPDPVKAPNAAVAEAGKLVGVGEKTAKGYRTALKKQRLREEAAAAPAVEEDAEPHEIAAALRQRIAGFSPRHAALVAEYEELRRRPGYQAAEENAS